MMHVGEEWRHDDGVSIFRVVGIEPKYNGSYYVKYIYTNGTYKSEQIKQFSMRPDEKMESYGWHLDKECKILRLLKQVDSIESPKEVDDL